MKEKLGQFKEFAGNLSSKTKKIIIAVAAGLVVAAVVIALILNNRPYAVLFTGLGEEEAREITAKQQEDGVYRHGGYAGCIWSSGSIPLADCEKL